MDRSRTRHTSQKAATKVSAACFTCVFERTASLPRAIIWNIVMRSVDRVRRLLCVSAAVLLVVSSHAQKQDAKAVSLLERARSVSGLESVSVPAYRLHATFTTFDSKGQQDGTGTVVQTGAPDGRIKRVVTFRGKTSTQVRTDGWHEVADEDYLETFTERRLLDAVSNPVPPAKDISQRTITLRPFQAGAASLQCAVVSVPVPDERNSQAALPSNAYCMDQQFGTVRLIAAHGGLNTLLNSLYTLGPVQVAGDIVTTQKGVTRGRLHIDELRKLPAVADAEFVLPTPTGGQVEGPRSIVQGDTMKGSVITKTTPVYPEFAKSQRISGSVTLEAIIGRDGTIRDLDLLTAPDDSLAKAAYDAVSTWRYKPFLRDGKPVEVETTITVNFAFR